MLQTLEERQHLMSGGATNLVLLRSDQSESVSEAGQGSLTSFVHPPQYVLQPAERKLYGNFKVKNPHI